MDSFLNEFLKSLCVGGQWSYAVFWKLDCLNSRILIWEDCFWDSSDKTGVLMQYLYHSYQFHVVGQGLVGRAVLTGNHEWILSDEVAHLEYTNELHIQYSAGVKTVVVVPIPTIGSVLLGSRFPIAENKTFAANIRSMLMRLQPSRTHANQPSELYGNCDASLPSQQCSYFPIPMSSQVKQDTADDLYGLIGLWRGSRSMDDNFSCVSGSTLNPNAQDNLLDAVVSKASHANTAFDFGKTKVEMESCSSTPSSALTSWVSCGGRQESASVALGNKCDEPRKVSRKRENPRPRPKDRQMIQDRVKELREIVPNGVKCSIDALLERTIKHMLFLQSVTKHAEKLKLPADSKLTDDFEGGKTWAYEVGSLSTLCPIVVQDLNSPRLLFVEMMCEERGFFLEIADLIRGMGFTIMKGTMECRNGNILAQFAVEADRDVTRRQVFMSLVHLLEQIKCKNLESDISSHSTLFPLTSIPATGGDILR